MTALNEPGIIKYEEIFLPDEEPVPSTSKEDDVEESSESDSEDDDDLTYEICGASTDQLNRAEKIRSETIGRILDSILPPRKIRNDGKTYLLRLSREPATRDHVSELSQRFEEVLKERQVRMNGFCPIRREIYDLLFDELIRQSGIHCPERGSFLLRVRDEFRMSLDAQQKLFDSGVEFGGRKALEGEIERRTVEIQCNQLREEVEAAEKSVSDLRAMMEAEETESQMRMEAREAKHRERIEFLTKLNKQLEDQISYIRPG
ncbi:hypothetical protein JTE90_018018 [Oedothorax gibbosus]|uniref:Uncharacterized protein n=1 Tax=Oedothorax gibbosus TaxID=931172 RepID=A0AAV6V703_9ARAC|nr:hypothetical protein JTE90_018018 [Oedothorax gibbosus]